MNLENISPDSESRLEQALTGFRDRVIPEFPNPHIEFPSEVTPQLQPSDQPLNQPGRPQSRRRWMSTVGGLSLVSAAIVFLVVVTASVWSRGAWAQVVDAVQKRPWVRMSMKSPDTKEQFELMFSPAQRVAAVRHPGRRVFVSLDLQEVRTYDEKLDTITVSDSTSFDEDEFLNLDAVMQSFTGRHQLNASEAAPRNKLLKQSQRPGRDGEQSWTDYVFDFEDTRRTPPQYRRIFRVPTGAKLPSSMTDESIDNGKTLSRVMQMDYPDSGPADLYALNVPRNAKIVNLHSSSDLKSVLKAYAKYQATGFDSDSAIVLTTVQQNGDWKWVNGVFKVRHDAAGYSAEIGELEPLMKLSMKIHAGEIPVPDTVAERLEWWKDEAGKLACQPYGQAETFFPGQSFVPNFVGYPSFGLPNEGVRGLLDPKPTIGPRDTVMITVEDGKSGSMLRRFWLAPERDFLCIRWEYVNAKAADWITTTIIDTAEKSPQGHWYATEIRRGAVEHSGDDLRSDTTVGPVGTATSRFLVEIHK
jgi:hypothetical protein